MEMTMAHYFALSDLRPAFDDWLRAENLLGENIYRIRFGEGQIVALTYPDPKRVVEIEGRKEVYSEERTFTVKSLPPPAVLERLRAFARTAPPDGAGAGE